METSTSVKMSLVPVLLVLLAVQTQSQPTKCATPNSLEGECINLENCPSIVALKNSKNLPREDIAFLRLSQCGYEGFKELVCCPVSTRYREFKYPEPPARPVLLSVDTRFKPPNELPGLKECGRQATDNRIFNGELTSIDEFPWMALLEYNMKQPKSDHGFACGGALISSLHVLTAAHCVTGQGEQDLGGLKSVRLGEHNIDTAEDCDVVYPNDCAPEPIDFMIAKVVVHPNYDEDSVDQMNDIALIKLAKQVEFNDFVRPICLSKELPPQVHAPGHAQFVAGWGKTETGRTSPVKLKIKVPLVDENSCSSKYTKFNIKIGPRQLCAGGEKDKDSCGGDSGGPLMVQAMSPSNGFVWYMTGVVSIGPQPCATNRIPGIYTKVFDYLDWILEHVRMM